MGTLDTAFIIPAPLSTVESRYGLRKSPVSMQTTLAPPALARVSSNSVLKCAKFSRV